MCRVFTTAGLVYIAGGLAYLLAGTSELQVRGVRGNNQRNMSTNGIFLGLGQERREGQGYCRKWRTAVFQNFFCVTLSDSMHIMF